MTGELIWTIVFGVIATAIGVVTIWQNFQIVHVKIESKTNSTACHRWELNLNAVLQRSHGRGWYRYGM
jgi:hypothetical protein